MLNNRIFRNVLAWGFVLLVLVFIFRNRLPIIHSFLYCSVGAYCQFIDFPFQISEPDLSQYNQLTADSFLAGASVLLGIIGFIILVAATVVGLHKVFRFIRDAKPRKVLTPVSEMIGYR
jgi:ABC-type spermidine/putrescine transport system permease subunit II